MKPLLIIGNKRSGSTQLMRLLNLHPNIHITNESDIVWILYQFYNNLEYHPYKHDAPAGMKATLDAYGHLLVEERSVTENFIVLMEAIMNGGGLKNDPVHKDQVHYYGDQKPYQNADPELMTFFIKHFPETRFVHLIRHPFAVVESSMKFGGGTGGYNWGGLEAKEILEKWTLFEQWSQELAQKFPSKVFHVKYEDLIDHTPTTMASLFEFLELEYDTKLLKACRKITLRNYKGFGTVEVPAETEKIMKAFGYSDQKSITQTALYSKIKTFVFRVLRKLDPHQF
jgi:hypothetical protein